jgi:hypothetical protein
MKRDAQLAREHWERYVYCRDKGHLDFVAKADQCDAFLLGHQWRPEDKAALAAQRRPAMTVNKILPIVETILGEQIHNRTEVLFRPKAGARADVADALSKVWMGISQDNQLPWVRSDVFASGIVRSRGFYDVRLDFSDTMRGDVRVEALNAKNVVIDPDAEEYDPDRWADVFLSKWMSGQDIEILYGKEFAKELAARGESSYPYGYDSLERSRDSFAAGRISDAWPSDPGQRGDSARNIRIVERQYYKLTMRPHFVDLATGDTRPVPENWDDNRIGIVLEKARGLMGVVRKKTRRIRWTTTADDLVLRDEWSPYKHFTVVPYFPFFQHGRTSGTVEHLIDSQEVLNKVTSQELHVVNTTANSGWLVEEGSLVGMSVPELEARGAQTGLVVMYRRGAQSPQKILPNQVPSGLDRLAYKAEEYLKTISNVSDSMQGFDREDVAARAIAYKQQRSGVNLAKAMDNLERSDYILARNALDIVQEYYTEPRLLTIVHEDLTRGSETLEVNVPDPATGEIVNDLTLGEYDIIITSSPHRASLEDSQFEQALSMRREGINIPDSVLIENSRLLRRSEILKEMSSAQSTPEAQHAAELRMRGMEAEVAKTEAEAQRILADARRKNEDAGLKAIDATTRERDKRVEQGIALEKQRAELLKSAADLEARQREAEARQGELFERQARERTMASRKAEAELARSIREEGDAKAPPGEMYEQEEQDGRSRRGV